jgi:hypothetical protein
MFEIDREDISLFQDQPSKKAQEILEKEVLLLRSKVKELMTNAFLSNTTAGGGGGSVSGATIGSSHRVKQLEAELAAMVIMKSIIFFCVVV